MARSTHSWLSWFRLERLIPLVTVIVALVAIGGSLLGYIPLTTFEQIALAILGLLAIDILIERMKLLEQISQDLTVLKSAIVFPSTLMWERQILQTVSFKDYIKDCNELFISGGHLLNLFIRQREVIHNWLEQNKNATLKLILESPEAALNNKTPVWSSFIDHSRENYAGDIKRSLQIIERLRKEFPNKVEVRLTEQVPSLTVMMIDKKKARVCFNLYMGEPEKRPVFELSKNQQPEWFDLFEERYRKHLWEDSKPTDTDVEHEKQYDHPLSP